MTASHVPDDPDGQDAVGGFDPVLGELVSDWIAASHDPGLARAALRARFVLRLAPVADVLDRELRRHATRPETVSVEELVVRAANCLSLHLLMLSMPQPDDPLAAVRIRLGRLPELALPQVGPADRPCMLLRCPACGGVAFAGSLACRACSAPLEGSPLPRRRRSPGAGMPLNHKIEGGR